jgi:site-specific DNA recombinase
MEQNAQKQRVAVYCRVASGSEDHSASLAAQKAYYTEMVDRHPEWELAGIYADKGIATTDRKKQKEFNKMLTACGQGKIDIILVRSVSRFARNVMDCLDVVQMLKASGVRVIFEKEGFDTSTEAGDLRIALFNELARRESESISMNLYAR